MDMLTPHNNIEGMHTRVFNNDLLDQLIYRGEGNSSIVVAIRGKSKIIRLLKKDGKLMKSSLAHHVSQHPMRSVQFIHLIMKPLTAPYMSESTQLAHLKSEFINILSKKVEIERPFHRLDKTLHLDDQYGLIMDDLCALPDKLIAQLGPTDLVGPTISVEIKPKQGFLSHVLKPPMKCSINDQMATRIKNNCLYGLTQNLKLSRGRIVEKSNYCPINLFSGCPIKMKAAIEELINHPQNNLRIFKDLALAYDDTNMVKFSSLLDSFLQDENVPKKPHQATVERVSDDSKRRFIEIIIQCLINQPSACPSYNIVKRHREDENFTSNNTHEHCQQHMNITKCRRCDIPTSKVKHKNELGSTPHTLPQSCVLAKVLQAQKLDTIGVFEARYMLEWLIDHTKDASPSIDILEELSRPQTPAGFGASVQLKSESKEDYYFRKVWEFLVSLTAKDCSIMVTLRRVCPARVDSVRKHPELRNHLIKEANVDTYYLFHVGIADFDQKMPLKILRVCDNLSHIANLNQMQEKAKKDMPSLQRNGNKKVIVSHI